MSTPPKPRSWPPAWGTYAFSVLAAVLIGLDAAGIGFCGMGLLVVPCVLLLALVTLFRSIAWWSENGVRSFVPLVVCLAAIPAGWKCASLHFELRFRMNEAHYERVAGALRARRYPAHLRPEDRSLGSWAKANEQGPEVVSVSFMALSHGFAGHAGYLRAFRDESEIRRGHLPFPWRHARRLGAHWYAVSD